MKNVTTSNLAQNHAGTVSYATETHTVVIVFKDENNPVKDFTNLLYKAEQRSQDKNVTKILFNKISR